jgi:hypothetical protein
MSGTDTPNDSDQRAVDLAVFINNHSALFVIMGVFAALAVYITQAAPSLGSSNDSELMATVGFVSALGMAILFLGLAYNELAAETGSWHNLYRAHFRLDNLPLALFTLFNLMLILSIGYLITRYEPAVFIIVLIATLFVGYGIVHRVVYGLANFIPRSPWARIPAIFVASLIVFFASNFAVEEFFVGVELSTIYELSLTEPGPVAIAVTYLLLVTVRSGAAIGVLASIIGIPVVAFDKIRGKSPYDNPE